MEMLKRSNGDRGNIGGIARPAGAEVGILLLSQLLAEIPLFSACIPVILTAQIDAT